MLLTFAGSLVGDGDGLPLVTRCFLEVAGTSVGDAVGTADLLARGGPRRAPLGTLDAVRAEVLVQEAMFTGRANYPVAGACVSEGTQFLNRVSGNRYLHTGCQGIPVPYSVSHVTIICPVYPVTNILDR